MRANAGKTAVITAGGSLNKTIVDSFLASIVYRWKNELIDRIIPTTEMLVKGFKNCRARMIWMKNVGMISAKNVCLDQGHQERKVPLHAS